MKTSLLVGFAFLLLIAGCGGGSSGDDDAGDDLSDDDSANPDDDTAADDDSDDDDDDSAPPDSADLTLPPYPWWPNDAMAVDETHLTNLATDYCVDFGVDAPDFLLGELPLASFNEFCDGAEATPPVALGSLYLSGYFGGLWLRDSLEGVFPKDGTSEGFEFLRPIFQIIVAMARDPQNVIATGDDETILAEARSGLAILSLLYGYNRGYLDQILAHPPDGVVAPEGIIACGENVFDCVMPDSPYEFMTRFDGALAALADPPNDRWADLVGLVDIAESATAQGELVWDVIPLDALDQNGYDRLIDLSAGFLVAAKSAVLGDMTAWANESPGDARCSLLLDAGMWTWSLSYFMGLASPAEPGTFPALECPDI